MKNLQLAILLGAALSTSACASGYDSSASNINMDDPTYGSSSGDTIEIAGRLYPVHDRNITKAPVTYGATQQYAAAQYVPYTPAYTYETSAIHTSFAPQAYNTSRQSANFDAFTWY